MAVYKEKLIIDIYSMARDGVSGASIAKALHVTGACFSQWKKTKKSVRYALKRGAEDRRKNTNLNWTEYISRQLPSHLQNTWEKITEYGRETNGYNKIEKLLSNESHHVKQELLVYAILICGFSISKALKKVSIPRKTFLYWAETDPDFVDLLNEVEQIKKDFYEEGLFKLVRAGDSPAIIFGNKTLNRDRGYGEVIETQISGMVGVMSLPISELGLPPEILRVILQAVEAKENKQKLLPPGISNVIDVENVPKKKRVSAKVK